MPVSDYLKTLPQYLIPQHLLSTWAFKFSRWPLGGITHWTIRRFIKHYGIEMDSAQMPDVHNYLNFNQFFTRALKSEARPLATTDLICPVDGEISQLGPIQEQCLLQAKGHSFSLVELLGGDVQMAELFKHGSFCTLYLSPKDYHRIHMPITGQLTDMVYVPGRLFSVNQRTARTVPRLFARNERVICLFATERGPVALVLVGAIFVGSIETVWSGRITPPYLSQLQRWHFTPEVAQFLQQGAEMGRFNLGSTVIVLVDGRQIAWLPEYAPPLKLLMGQALGRSLLP